MHRFLNILIQTGLSLDFSLGQFGNRAVDNEVAQDLISDVEPRDCGIVDSECSLASVLVLTFKDGADSDPNEAFCVVPRIGGQLVGKTLQSPARL